MRKIKSPELKKHSVTFSIPVYLESWLEKMQVESPGFNKNKVVIDVLTKYMQEREGQIQI